MEVHDYVRAICAIVNRTRDDRNGNAIHVHSGKLSGGWYQEGMR